MEHQRDLGKHPYHRCGKISVVAPAKHVRCDWCRKTSRPCLVTDISGGEYGEATLCVDCVQRMFENHHNQSLAPISEK